MKAKKNTKNVMKPLVSVHVVHYACSNCGEEKEEVKMCNDCNAPMRVIQVVELYGDEANEYLDNLKESSVKKVEKKTVAELQFDDSVSGADALDEEEELLGVDELELGEIFPDEEEEENDESEKKFVGDLGDDFEAALSILDEEEDELADDMEDLPEL